MFRQEIKYQVNDVTAHLIRSRLSALCCSDKFADSDGQYRVTSLYFDDFCNSAVADNLSGQLSRKKFRIRIYNGDDTFIRLERKVKHGAAGYKDSAVLTREQYALILSGDYEFMCCSDNPVFKDFYLVARTRLLRPSVVVDYIREAFVYEPGHIRITLDKAVSASATVDLFAPDAVYAPILNTGEAILEVKFTGFLPGHISRLISNNGGLRQSTSKYTLCRLKTR